MNLWARTLRQLTILSVALFFFSCENESSLLGFKNPRQKFNVRYVDIPLTTSQVMSVDSVITDLRPYLDGNRQTQYVDGVVVGTYQDPDFGQVTAQPYLPIFPASNTAFNSTAVFDSITVQLQLNFYAYGFSGVKEFQIPVHEITGDTLTFFGGQRYYANSTPPAYAPDALGEVRLSVDRDYLLEEADSAASAQDTLLLTGRLSDEFGVRVFDAMKSGFTTVEQQNLFRASIRGLTLVPGAEPGILGMKVANPERQVSRVFVHYHTLTEGGAVDDTLRASLRFEYTSFSKIETDRSGTELAALTTPYQPFEPLSDQRYVQSGNLVVTRIDLAPFYEFADTVQDILINSAEFVINNIYTPEGLDPHKAFLLRPMTSNNQFLNTRIPADREFAANYYITTSVPDYHYFAATELGPATLDYDEEHSRFSGFITLYTQTLFANKNGPDGINENRQRYLALAPANLPLDYGNRASTRTVFNKDDVSLRIFYTRANGVTP